MICDWDRILFNWQLPSGVFRAAGGPNTVGFDDNSGNLVVDFDNWSDRTAGPIFGDRDSIASISFIIYRSPSSTPDLVWVC